MYCLGDHRRRGGERTCQLQKQHILLIAFFNFNANCSAVANGPLCDTKKLSDTLGQRNCYGLVSLFFLATKWHQSQLCGRLVFWDRTLKGVQKALARKLHTHMYVQNVPPVLMLRHATI